MQYIYSTRKKEKVRDKNQECDRVAGVYSHIISGHLFQLLSSYLINDECHHLWWLVQLLCIS